MTSTLTHTRTQTYETLLVGDSEYEKLVGKISNEKIKIKELETKGIVSQSDYNVSPPIF